MRVQDVRELSDDQLKEELTKAYREYQNLRFRMTTNQLPDTNQPKFVRKSIARLQTIMKERGLE
ncbi:MAG TPA: 50S ribosomal protein L29 [Dehalococcoidia bacterium]|jgi:large subunit ribosomal protein L29|nr:50S ribosomal protein L29 [Dehalococcoidia bacterium]